MNWLKRLFNKDVNFSFSHKIGKYGLTLEEIEKKKEQTRTEPVIRNKTDERIMKLFYNGLNPEQIARKIGRPDDIDRVVSAIRKNEPFFKRREDGEETNGDCGRGCRHHH